MFDEEDDAKPTKALKKVSKFEKNIKIKNLFSKICHFFNTFSSIEKKTYKNLIALIA